MKTLLNIVLLLVVTNSCDSSKKAMENNKKMQESPSGTYTIIQLLNTDVSAHKLTITFDEASNNVSGFAGCNSYFGNYTVENNTISFSNMASSKKLCRETMAIEDQFLKTLHSVNSFSINETSISFSENDKVLINGMLPMNTTAGKSAEVRYEDKVEVKYQALSRNSFDFILISKSGIKISKDKNLLNIDTYPIETEDWEALNRMIEAIDAETLKDLKAPSKKHQYDGAPHTTLAIILGDVEYMSPTFDEGNPPAKIEALVNKLLSIKESSVKQ